MKTKYKVANFEILVIHRNKKIANNVYVVKPLIAVAWKFFRLSILIDCFYSCSRSVATPIKYDKENCEAFLINVNTDMMLWRKIIKKSNIQFLELLDNKVWSNLIKSFCLIQLISIKWNNFSQIIIFVINSFWTLNKIHLS